ncbi:DMT family transporter [Syntrophorhabdus aromaticivorans]|uniref:DMT family transporter n=1 Tax=Syntrophorhabdus aromaticivorans TaxID=328301 RepID=A0A351U1X6_9BACT|nr:DMT family transporter [Syntrophorhabdus aromaticivorans]NLW36746.1 DMT family transporter [Syntrophorhabdus aromaticivorans]HBA53957.1 EamA/RhaT family transporter [Syntrophorhabdus aromaticivorans]
MKGTKTSAADALISACLFGISAPLAKIFLAEIEPVLMASFLYLGSGLGLLGAMLIQAVISKRPRVEAGLGKHDMPWLLGATLSGGIAAPIVLMVGLKHTPAATASLLLNFEGTATVLIAAMVFREATSPRIWTAVVFVTFASILLSLETKGELGFSPGAVGIVCACALWGIDNNLTRHISSKDPITIGMVKGVIAGIFSLVLALIVKGESIPGLTIICLSLLTGFVCYGLSIVFFIRAMRALGSARTSAYFASAPFIGTAVSFVIFQELPNMFFAVSLPFMVAGIILLFNEKHSHLHTHFEAEHEHIHDHDDGHHNHFHDGNDGNKRHTHFHKHEHITHDHEHMPDTHHRHRHEE